MQWRACQLHPNVLFVGCWEMDARGWLDIHINIHAENGVYAMRRGQDGSKVAIPGRPAGEDGGDGGVKDLLSRSVW
nr:hypothetical protein CFP56_32490 [Quercus suber]